MVVQFSLKYENIKSMIFIWRMEEKEKKLLYNIITKHKFSKYILAWMEEMNYNNFEIIEIIDKLTNYDKLIDINNIEPFIVLLQGIRFEKLNKKMKPFFSKILNNIFKKTIKDSFEKYFMEVVVKKVNDLKKIDDFEYICICIDKLIEKEKEKEIEIEKEKGKEKDLNINENWIELIDIISNKYLTLLNEIKNEEIENENEFAEITSKLIYLNYKYGIKKEPLFSDKIGTKLLNNIYIIFLDKYVISDLFFEKLIIDLITKRKFGIIYNKLVGKEYISKFKKLLNKSIIEFDGLFEENNFNILLLDIAYKNKFFESFKISSYTKNTIEKLKTIGNRIININNISLNQMEFLLKEKNLINFFSLIDEPFKDNINENLQKNISEIKSIIQIENLDEIEHQKLKFSSRNEIVDSIGKIIKKLKNEKLQGLNELKKKCDKIKYVLNLIKKLENKISFNYFFKVIQEKNMDYSLFEQNLIIFGGKKTEEINANLIPLFNDFLNLEPEKKENIIIDLDDCNHLLNMINLNNDFEKTNECHQYAYDKISKFEIIKIIKKIILYIIKDKIKDIYNNYILFKQKIKSEKNEINNNNILLFNSFLSSLGIKEEIINKTINDIIIELNRQKFIKILKLLFKNLEAFDFLFSITSQDCRNIQELAGEVHGGNNQNFLSIEDLLII